MRGHINHDQIVGLGKAGDTVELLLDVFRRRVFVGELVDIVGRKLADVGIFKSSGKGVGVSGGEVELGNLRIGKVTLTFLEGEFP
jgi:hypothetical protein